MSHCLWLPEEQGKKSLLLSRWRLPRRKEGDKWAFGEWAGEGKIVEEVEEEGEGEMLFSHGKIPPSPKVRPLLAVVSPLFYSNAKCGGKTCHFRCSLHPDLPFKLHHISFLGLFHSLNNPSVVVHTSPHNAHPLFPSPPEALDSHNDLRQTAAPYPRRRRRRRHSHA